MTRAIAVAPAALTLALTLAARETWAQPAGEKREDARDAPAAGSLGAIPEPVLEGFEDVVREQLVESRGAVEQMLADGSQRADAYEALGTLCLLYLRYELMDSAEPCLRLIRTHQPRDFRWPYYQTILYVRDGELDEARASVEAALALRPDDVPALLRAGDLYLRREETEQAASAFAAALERDPASSAARFGLGRIAAASGDDRAAAAHFEAALAGQPEGSVVHYHLGMAYRALGDLERARTELAMNRQQAIAFRDPLRSSLDALSVSQRALFIRGVDARGRGRPDLAIDLFEQVLAADPDHAEAHYNIARALIEVDRASDAEAHLRRAIEIRPDFADAQFNLAVLLGRRGAADEAARHLERAAELDPEDLPTRVLWARLLAQRGESERAIVELERVLALDAAAPGARPALVAIEADFARQLARRGDFAAAAERFVRLVDLSPDDAEAHLGRGMTLVLAGSYQRAREALEASAGRFPDQAPLADLLARLLATCPEGAVRDGRRAVAIAEQVVEIAPTVDHTETLAMALAEAGRWDEAVAAQRRALSLEKANGQANSDRRLRRLAFYERREPVRAPWLGR
jgi:tetratricopeptide (TPR) repeat protein